MAVDENRAAAALALGAAPVLGRADAQLVAQGLQQRGPLVCDLSRPTVDDELHGHRSSLARPAPAPDEPAADGKVTA
jgi:hypothetical protein